VATVRTACQLCLDFKPDLIVLDAKLPGLSGADILRRISKKHPTVRVMVFSGHENPGSRPRDARSRGPRLCGKDRRPGRIQERPGDHRATAAPISGPAVAALLRSVVANNSPISGADSLTDREREILKLVAESHSTKEIAVKLGISSKTVDNHRTNLMRKLNLHDVASLTRYALEIGLIDHRAQKPLNTLRHPRVSFLHALGD
jgi:DNA-binding NarL/FixJ family response regulator